MEDKVWKNALQQLRTTAQKRKFSQSIDLIINIKDLQLKNTENQFDLFISLPHPKGKPAKICALIGPELKEQANACDKSIFPEDFPDYQADKKKIKQLANEYDFFIAQANLMTDIAKVFGRILGPKGKMPNPKAGCVVPANANLKQVKERLANTIKASLKQQASIKCTIGKEDMNDDDLTKNLQAIYTQVLHKLPNEKNNIKNVLLKFTMSKPLHVGSTGGKP